MNWLALITAVLQSLPGIIMSLETLVGPGNGTDVKKSAAIAIATAPAILAGATPTQVQALAETSGVVIDATVASLNAAQVFKTTPKS